LSRDTVCVIIMSNMHSKQQHLAFCGKASADWSRVPGPIQSLLTYMVDCVHGVKARSCFRTGRMQATDDLVTDTWSYGVVRWHVFMTLGTPYSPPYCSLVGYMLLVLRVH
jgi:hypothetical protein